MAFKYLISAVIYCRIKTEGVKHLAAILDAILKIVLSSGQNLVTFNMFSAHLLLQKKTVEEPFAFVTFFKDQTVFSPAY